MALSNWGGDGGRVKVGEVVAWGGWVGEKKCAAKSRQFDIEEGGG